MEVELRNPLLWVAAIILGAVLAYVVGPLTGVAFPNDLLYSGPGYQVLITGWTEYVIFIVIVRVVLGAQAAKKALEKL